MPGSTGAGRFMDWLSRSTDQMLIPRPISITMRNLLFIPLFALLCTQLLAQKTPLRRADSFFGLHFDFHANTEDSLVGKTLTEGMIDSLLSAVKPDFIQVDSKGHPGVVSYPSKVANATTVKSFAKDPLALFRQVTKKHGVALYVHYSGVWDDAALRKHPEWAAVDANGKASTQKTSVHSYYVDDLLIPQLKEIADYGVDGVWVDGDCWATVLDYSVKSLEKFKRYTGIKTVPKTKSDPDYPAFMYFARESFKNYVGRYTNALHYYKPGFQVASNWAFSSFMPEPVELNVDFMSGDLAPMNGVNSALFEARVLAAQSRHYNKPWDLMSWSFNTQWGTSNHCAKTALNLSQEAAEVIAMGGAFQCYFTQNRDASIRVQQVNTMAELAKFVRARQPFTQGARAIPQVALLYSLASYHKYSSSIYGNGVAEASKAILSTLMDAQHAVEVLSEHHLRGNLAKYPLVVIPEWAYLEEDFLQELKTYVYNGGKLLVIGAEAFQNFKTELGIEPQGQALKSRFWVMGKDNLGLGNDWVQPVKLLSQARSLGSYYLQEDTRFPAGSIASIADYGQGKIAGIYGNLGSSYHNFQSPQLRDFLDGVVQQLFPQPLVEVSGSKLVHLTVNELNGKLTINLVNAGGNYNSDKVSTYDELPALRNLTLKIRSSQKPLRIIQQPEQRPLAFSYDRGVVTVKVPEVGIHSILVVSK